jgi:hypothetical protein
MDLEFVLAIRGHDKCPRPHRQQVALPHDAHDLFVIHRHTSPPQFCCNAAVTVASSVFDSEPPIALPFIPCPGVTLWKNGRSLPG